MGGDVLGHSLQGVEVVDLGGILDHRVILGDVLVQQRLVVDQAVGLDYVCHAGNLVAVLQGEGIAGKLLVQLSVGQIIAVVLPGSQANGAVHLEQGGCVGLGHIGLQGGLVGAGGGGDHVHGNAGLLGVLGSQLHPLVCLLGLEVQIVDSAAGSVSGGGGCTGGGAFAGLGCTGRRSGAAAGHKAQRHGRCKHKCKCLFHSVFLLF